MPGGAKRSKGAPASNAEPGIPVLGRPSDYCEATADAICDKLADGQSLRKICLADDMPSQATVFRWLADERYSSFREQYTRAREAQADAIFDECLDIADDGANDYMGDDEKYNGDAVARSRLRVDTRKWMAGKLRPKVYGDKLDLEHSGGVTVEILRIGSAA